MNPAELLCAWCDLEIAAITSEETGTHRITCPRCGSEYNFTCEENGAHAVCTREPTMGIQGNEVDQVSKYQYKTDDGEIHEVDFGTAVDAGAFLELSDGRIARRINRPSMKKRTKSVPGSAPIISDALGFTDNQLGEMRANAEAFPAEHRGIEFVQDPTEPRFYQVHCSSEKAKQRYMKHRKFTDRNSRNGAGNILSPEAFEKARAMVQREHGEADTE